MDHPFEIREILAAYFACLPDQKRARFFREDTKDPDGLALYWEGRLVGGTKNDILASFDYYGALMEIGRTRAHALSYNEPAAAVYPFVVERVAGLLPEGVRKKLLTEANVADVRGLTRAMTGSLAVRNAFRRAFVAGLNGPILSFLYSMVYLMGFSSGGEASFLERVFPRVAKWGGRLLDAGGGSGFAAMAAASRGPVTYVDFSPFRARRAQATAEMCRTDPKFLAGMLDLIDRESAVFGLKVDRSLVPPPGGDPIDYRSADLLHLPADFGPFDGAILTDVLEHTTDPEAALVSVSRTLAPGAPLLVTVPTDANGIQGKIREEEEGYAFPFLLHIEFFSDERIERMGKAAGMSVEQLCPFSYETASCVGPAPMEVMAILKKR